LAGMAFTLICCPPPPDTSERLAGAAERVKSPAGPGLEPPPQELNRSKERKLIHPARAFEQGLISEPPGSACRIYVNLVRVRQLACKRRYTQPLPRLS
jgi:hypothetical protein